MSFSTTREYSRSLLRPIGLSTSLQPPSLQDSKSLPGVSLRQPPTTSSSWNATTHTFVGAGQRAIPSAWPPARFSEDPAAIPDDAKHNVHYQAESAQQHSSGSAKASYRIFDAVEQSTEDTVPPPRLVAKRYVPVRQNSGSADQITLLMLTGMGLPKEMFEPMIDGLLADNSPNIGEIWAVDMPLSGETALVNQIGYLYGNEKDIARDLLLFVTSYLPLSAGQSLPAELSRRTFDASASQPTRPNLHVVAHSLGAQSAMLIAAHAPDLFASLTVFDPAMIPDGKIRKAFTAMPKDVLCTGIPHISDSRAALSEEIRSNRRTRGWDQRCQNIFVERGAVQDGQGKIRLTAHPRLEWALYYDQETPTHCYDRLTDITVPLNAIMPARPFAVPPAMLEADIAKLKQKTRLTWIPKSTHQLPFERVDECTRLVIAWLKDLVPSAKL